MAMATVLLRAVPWLPVSVLAAATGLLLGLAGMLGESFAAYWLVLLSLSLASASASFVLDEDAEAVVDATPTSTRRRLAGRLVVVGVPGLVGTVGLLTLGRSTDLVGERFVLVLAGCLFIGVVAAAVLRRSGRPAPGDLAAVVAAVATALLLGADPLGRWVSVLPGGHGRDWAGTAALWSGVILAATLVLLWTSRDPAARHTWTGRP